MTTRPLEPMARREPKRWFKDQPAAVLCLALGALAIVVASIFVMAGQGLFAELPDLRVMLPMWIACAGCGAASVLRKERSYALVLAGVALASASLLLGWVLALVAVAAVALVIIHVLGELM
jgi:hypothetical protein